MASSSSEQLTAVASGPNETHADLASYRRQFGNEDDDLPPQPTTTRRELWSYYLYYNGDNGVGPISYSQALFQSTLNDAGHIPNSTAPCTVDSACVVSWGSGTRSVASIVLIANGICFAAMTLLFIILGSAADYGSFGRHLLLVLTLICWVFQFAFMAIRRAEQWHAAMALFCISYISYGATLVFYAAMFPRLARFLPEVRKAREDDLPAGRVTRAEYEMAESLARNHVSNISTAHSNIGYLCTLLLNLSVLLPLQGNPYAKNLALLLTTLYWLLLGTPWFIIQQPRPGPPLPKGASYFTIGLRQVWIALRSLPQLPQTFLYLAAYFLLSDGLNTTGTLVSIIQNQRIAFSFLQITYLGLMQALCSITSTLGCAYLQRRFRIRTKSMFVFTNVFSVLIPMYGLLGIRARSTVGYKSPAEFYIYNFVFGLTQAPYYAYAQSMMSELTPPGCEGLFFGLFGLTNRAGSVMGPNVVQAVIESAGGRVHMGFPVLVGMCGVAAVLILGVDVERGREEARAWGKGGTTVRTMEVGKDAGAGRTQALPTTTGPRANIIPEAVRGIQRVESEAAAGIWGRWWRKFR